MEPKCASESKEVECLLDDISSKIKEADVNSKETFEMLDENIQNGLAENDKITMEKDGFEPFSPLNSYELKIWKKKKLSINKSLLTFRIAQFLWHGAGSVPSLFLGIFVKQRGLSIVEISTAFSLIFVFQFLCCSITGIITDKIGNAKPVLMFLMLSTASVIVSISLTPNINNVSCILKEENSNNSDHFEIEKNISSCYMNCTFSKHILSETSYASNTILENSSLPEKPDLEKNITKNACNFSTVLPNISPESTKDDCCYSCINKMKVDCVTDRKGYLVVVFAILIVSFQSLWNTTYRFMNFAAISLASKNDSDFGKELVFAKSGNFLVMIITGFVLNIDKSPGSEINLDPIIWFASVIMFLACISILLTNVPILPPGKHLRKKAFSLMRDTNILAFILLVFMAGNGFAFNFTFHLVFLQTINPPSIVVALHSISMVLYGFFTLLTSKWWLKKFGTNKLFVLCLMFYVINFTACSYLQNPWWILVLDICIAFTYDLFWVSVVVHCFSIAPVGFVATLNALTGSVHYGIGRSSGVFFGGMMINYMGLRQAYRAMAAIMFATAILYCIFMHCRRKPSTVNAIFNGNGDTKKEITKSASTDST